MDALAGSTLASGAAANMAVPAGVEAASMAAPAASAAAMAAPAAEAAGGLSMKDFLKAGMGMMGGGGGGGGGAVSHGVIGQDSWSQYVPQDQQSDSIDPAEMLRMALMKRYMGGGY
jgi:hypothetical protein